jgi:hypothetical protein
MADPPPAQAELNRIALYCALHGWLKHPADAPERTRCPSLAAGAPRGSVAPSRCSVLHHRSSASSQICKHIRCIETLEKCYLM